MLLASCERHGQWLKSYPSYRRLHVQKADPWSQIPNQSSKASLPANTGSFSIPNEDDAAMRLTVHPACWRNSTMTKIACNVKLVITAVCAPIRCWSVRGHPRPGNSITAIAEQREPIVADAD